MTPKEAILTEKSAITLAIFPFENLTAGNSNDIFCRSFSLDLITELSRFSQFQIIAYQTIRDFDSDGGDESVLEQLYTDYFVKGSFRSDRDTIRINAQLFESRTHRLVWANRFEDSSSAIQDIQESLLRELVSSLQQQLNYDLLSQIKRKSRVKLKAYEYWLYGMEELKKGSLPSDLKAREYFQQALELEPEYSWAYSGMSLTYFNEWSCQLWDRWDVSKSGASEWAQKAIELDDQNYHASMVLGKLFLFERSYETAEYYLWKSLHLNSNDPESLIPIAAYFVYLGHKKEAVELYEKALRLNPIKASIYRGIGAFIFFEAGDYKKAASLVIYSNNAGWADADAYHAAIFYHLRDWAKMQSYWSSFLEKYQKTIKHGEAYTQAEAIEWLLKINPHRYASNLSGFLAYISKGHVGIHAFSENSKERDIPHQNLFYKESNVWNISFEGLVIQLSEAKGFHDIQKLLAQPEQCVHCAELMGNVLDSTGENVIDVKARNNYRKKLMELQQEIETAEAASNWIALESLHSEYDMLMKHLSQSLGLKGKPREAGSTIEKARSAVTWRIRSAIAKIESVHPALGRHLSNSIKTGIVCKYRPEQPIEWATTR